MRTHSHRKMKKQVTVLSYVPPRTHPLTHFEKKSVVVINKRKMDICWWDLEM